MTPGLAKSKQPKKSSRPDVENGQELGSVPNDFRGVSRNTKRLAPPCLEKTISFLAPARPSVKGFFISV
jgi:hypothetical protein